MACTGEEPTASPAELLIGKWKFETMNLPEVAKAQMDDQARVQFAMMLNQMQPLKYSFFEDGTYSFDMELAEGLAKNMERGNYQLMNDGAVITTEPDPSSMKDSKNNSFKIVLLTADSLVLGDDDRGKVDIVFLHE